MADRWFDWLRAEVQGRLPFSLQAPESRSWQPVDDHVGWHEQGDGQLYVGIYIENGRIADVGDVRPASGLRHIVEELRPQVRLTAQQNVILAGIKPADRQRVQELMASYCISPVQSIPPPIRLSMPPPTL